MTVALFVEAVDSIRTLGWALAVWIVLLAVATTLAAYTVVAAVAWPCTTARDALYAALSASQALRALPERHAAHNAAHARTAPSWAHADKEAA
ncbi:hypothetical protein ABZZ74_23530 [Streptomyces sp. NPDC006476]|uniref:hypothetical protein n=1 Tax=Streptomyces sp. NPDC006476 TaxID=3157175 RepID=UPI0033A7F8B2